MKKFIIAAILSVMTMTTAKAEVYQSRCYISEDGNITNTPNYDIILDTEKRTLVLNDHKHVYNLKINTYRVTDYFVIADGVAPSGNNFYMTFLNKKLSYEDRYGGKMTETMDFSGEHLKETRIDHCHPNGPNDLTD